MRILMLSATFPYPPTRGGTQVRTFNLLKFLRQRHRITLMTQRSPDVTDAEVEELRGWVDELAIFPRPEAPGGGLGAKVRRWGEFLATGTPPSVKALASPEIQGWVDRAVASGEYGALTCEHCVNELYVRPEFRQRLTTLVNIHSSVYGTCRNQLATGTSENVWRDRLNLPLLKRYEQRYSQKFSQLVVTTRDDAQQMRVFAPQTPIHVIPNGVDFEQFPWRSADPGGHRVIFVGAMDNLQNIDAARFFALEVLPLLQERYPSATLKIVGARPTPEVVALGDRPGVTVTGRVPSMVEYLHQATVCVVPMRTGFGIKNKTLEAMAAGVPVVASDRGLEGLAVDGDAPLRALRANQVSEYLEALGRLFDQGDLRAELSRNARALIETEYTWEEAGRRYEQALLAPPHP